MTDMKIINEPDHYVLDRFIQPINVIEDWSLCHHLACVVKYICPGRTQEPYPGGSEKG